MQSTPNIIRFIFSGGKSYASRPAVFIDRDGVINRLRSNDYVLDWRQFVFTPGIREALKSLSTLELPMIIISNQAAVGKGLLKLEVLQEITQRLYEALLSDSIALTACYYCPHTIQDNCDCRKPKSAMLSSAAADFNIDLQSSIFIGDSETDVRAAQSVGCQPIVFGPASISDRRDWTATVPVARKATDLFHVANSSLQRAAARKTV